VEFANVRDLKARASEFIRKKEPVMVFRGSKLAGIFIPWEDINIEDEVRKAVLKALAEKIAGEREEKGITEEEVLEDFEAFRKGRHRR